ncbi:MAG: POTRA domain-containing protein, partial [Bacteroidota bacterium]
MNLKAIGLFCLAVLSCLYLPAQQKGMVAEVAFEGLKRTQESHLRRFLRTNVGQPLEVELIQADQQRLQNLYSIAQAKHRLDSIGPKQWKVVFLIEEAWTLFPQVSISGVEDNVWFEIGATELNLSGRGILLSAAYRNIDGRSNYQVYFQQPYIGGSQWGVSAGLHRYASTEPLYFPVGAVQYDYTNLSAEAGVSYEFSLGHRLSIGTTYFIERYERLPHPEQLPSSVPVFANLPKLLVKASHQLDRLNYHGIYLSGWVNYSLLESVYNMQYEDFFQLFINDFHYFRRIKYRGNLAARIRVGLSSNTDSPFAPFVLDSRINIRGSGNRVDRGTGTVIMNLEYRHSFLERRNLAIQGVVFSDIGVWRTPGGGWDDFVNPEYLRHFVGSGIRIIYPRAHNAMLR